MTQAQPIDIAPTPKERKTYFPFRFLLRSSEYQGKGACLAENCYIKDGRLKKAKGQDVFKDLGSSVGSLVWLHEYLKEDGTYQTMVAYLSGTTYKLRAIEEDLTVVTPGLETKTTETGTVDIVSGSPNITGTSTAFTTEFSVGDYIEISPGDGVYYKIKTITSDTAIVLTENYAGSSQVGSSIKLVVHPNGLGDIEFTSSNFDMTQIGTTGYISNESTTTNGYTWNGEVLVAITNMPDNPKFILRDGNRIAVNKQFSGEELPNFTAGSAVQSDGDYAMSIDPVGGVEAGAGLIVMGKMGAEAHKAIPNNASDNMSALTKLQGFNYTGLGIQNTHQIVAAKNYVYFFNEKGIHEMNPYDGSTNNLAENGNIYRRWKEYDLSNAFIAYVANKDWVVVVVKSIGQNDTMVVIDLEKKERPISIMPSAFFLSGGNVGGSFKGGSSHDGKIIDMFDTYTDRDATKLQFRYIIEWDALTNPVLEKRLKRFVIFANLNPQSSFTAKLYKDGYHEPIKTETFTTTAATGTAVIGSTHGAWGKYVFDLGGGRDIATSDLNSDKIKRVRKNTKVSTFTLEIIEKSFYEFSVQEIMIEYKTKGRIIREQTLPNVLF